MNVELAAEPRTGRLASAASWACFCAGYLATYFVSTAVPTPLLWYYPLQHRFVFEVRPNGLAADYYGRVLLSLAVGGLVAAASWALLRRAADSRVERTLRVVGGWALALLIFTAAMYVYLLIGRSAYPAPLPPGYVPR